MTKEDLTDVPDVPETKVETAKSDDKWTCCCKKAQKKHILSPVLLSFPRLSHLILLSRKEYQGVAKTHYSWPKICMGSKESRARKLDKRKVEIVLSPRKRQQEAPNQP